MRVCATYGVDMPLIEGVYSNEVRLDVFDEVPSGLGENDIIALCGKDISLVPDSFTGLVDVGGRNIPTGHRKIRSVHDHGGTPDPGEIVKMLEGGDCEVSKGAFLARSFADLHSIFEASGRLSRKHILLGMGEIGKVTRIRQHLLGNEVTFGYVSHPTAPGQLSFGSMSGMSDDTVVVGLVGHPLSHSSSHVIQNAAISSAGLDAIYLEFDSPDTVRMRDVILEYDIRGVNVTLPYKESIFGILDDASEVSRRIGAANTVVNEDGRLCGENTDAEGILYALECAEADVGGRNVLIMGSGGAARAAAYVFDSMGCRIQIAGRNVGTVADICGSFGAERHEGGLDGIDVVVNCTPIGIIDGEYPAEISGLNRDQTVFDMVYGRRTALIEAASKAGCRVVDGADMLIGQGVASFEKWFGRRPDVSVMRGAIA